VPLFCTPLSPAPIPAQTARQGLPNPGFGIGIWQSLANKTGQGAVNDIASFNFVAQKIAYTSRAKNSIKFHLEIE
jgi:hypothetical protein